MASKENNAPDHWSSKSYTAAAPFVPQLTTRLLALLAPAPTDRILDLGCGDGALTARIARALVPRGAVLGLDASAAMIAAATSAADQPANASYRVADCADLRAAAPDLLVPPASSAGGGGSGGGFDKVVSNAALHWILGGASVRGSAAARRRFFGGVRAALRGGGAFAFEMGGAGNVGEVHGALVAALVARGVGSEEARAASPWWFPSEAAMRAELEGAGFAVEVLETEYRPTRLNEEGEGEGGLEGWVRLMGATFLERVAEGEREGVVRWVCEVLEGVVRRPEDGGRWLGYVRLRGVARKIGD